jgi:hypothetical protein
MIMRITKFGFKGMAIAFIGSAAAAPPTAAPPAAARPAAAAHANAPQINAQQLGVMDRAVEFCTPVDADSAKKLKDKIAQLTKGASADAVAQARSSDGYKEAYSTMGNFIGEIDPRNAKVACENTAGGK